jgi:hypothetical protein
MSQQYMHLVGAEDALNASRVMKEAASSMRSSVDQMMDTMQRHQQMIWDFQNWFSEISKPKRPVSVERIEAILDSVVIKHWETLKEHRERQAKAILAEINEGEADGK